MPDVYTHGHHESVLRSHTWRTAENSAAYLLPHLAPGLALLDVGCGPGTITADLAAARGAGPGRRPRPVRGPARPGALGRAGPRAEQPVVRRRRRLRAGPPGRHVRRRPRPPGAPAPGRPDGRPARDGAGDQARRADRGPRGRLRRDGLAPAQRRADPVARDVPRGGPRQRRGPGRRARAAGLGPPRRLHRRHALGRRRGATPRPPTGPGGPGCGPTGSPAPRWPTRPSPRA